MPARFWTTSQVPYTLQTSELVTIEGAYFAAAYFGVWLGREPIDEKLRRDLLAGG